VTRANRDALLERSSAPASNTLDLDICPARDRANLERLAAFLNEAEARLRVPGYEERGIEIRGGFDPAFVDRFHSVATVTRWGPFDDAAA
jgi:hypothetical protein